MKHRFLKSQACLRSFVRPSGREDGLGTLEIVVITGILLTVALIFNVQIRSFASRLFDRVFNDSNVISNILR